jgi:transcriptional regulator with XRE-family HTH domain
MASEEGLKLRPEMREKLAALSQKRVEKEAEERAARRLLRQKIMGVLIKKARLKAGKSLKETSDLLGCSPDRLSQYESGEKAPSLPEVEMMARLYSVMLDELLDEDHQPKEPPAPPPTEMLDLRHKIIGVQLRQRRNQADLTQKDLAQRVDVSSWRLSQYERGLKPIPVPELEALAAALDLRLTDLVDDDLGPDSAQARQQKNLERLDEMPEEIQNFVLNPVNALYVEMAMKVSRLPADTLRQIAEGLLDITY